jgi:hypothetical protein
MSGDHRLDRLRDLVGRLERLPDSDERDKVLGEVRARVVDLDTGATPRSKPTARAPRGAGVRMPDRPGARAVPLPATVNVTHVALNAECPTRPSWWWSRAPRRRPTPVIHSFDMLVAGERLCLAETAPPNAPLPEGHPPRAWERGLRG